VDSHSVSNITVLGQGVMGPDIALGFAMAGYRVTGVDIADGPLHKAAQKIKSNCRQMVDGGMLTETESNQICRRISFSLDLEESVRGADYVMEAVPEDMGIKQEIFAGCGDLCPPWVVVASNTSSMSITRIASGMRFAERAITTHWTIPAHLSPMVEVARGEKTSDETESCVVKLLEGMGKCPVVCKDTPGFIHNYIQFAMIRAALDLIESGTAAPQDVDRVVKNGFGLRISSVGPVEFMDMCGLDTILKIQQYLFQMTGSRVYEPSKTIEDFVSQGNLGVKSGKGFYSHGAGRSEGFWERTNPAIIRILGAIKRS